MWSIGNMTSHNQHMCRGFKQHCGIMKVIHNFDDCILCSQELIIQWNLQWETIAMRDQPLTRDQCCSNMALHFHTFVLVIKDHLSHKTTFCGPLRWSLVARFTVTHFAWYMPLLLWVAKWHYPFWLTSAITLLGWQELLPF